MYLLAVCRDSMREHFMRMTAKFGLVNRKEMVGQKEWDKLKLPGGGLGSAKL